MERGIMKKSKNVTRIKCKMISLCLSSVMIILSFMSINVMADSSDQIINSLTDIPAVLEDWDTPALGSGKIYYRKTSAKIGSATPAQNYQTALNTSFKDNQYPINGADSSLADENTLIVTEADLHTDFSYVEELGYELARSKEYKTNKHIFLYKRK